VKRVIWPAGSRWSVNMKPHVGTEWCLHAHVGFLAQGRIEGEYQDGCTFSFAAPAVVVIEPEHDAWIPGEEDAVLIQFDAESDTAAKFGLPARHEH
jgi:hypothetical protein